MSRVASWLSTTASAWSRNLVGQSNLHRVMSEIESAAQPGSVMAWLLEHHIAVEHMGPGAESHDACRRQL